MNQIKAVREKLNLSRKDITEKIGVPYRTLQNWETGDNDPQPWVEKLLVEKMEQINRARGDGGVKWYKDTREYVGCSDIAALTLVGMKEEGGLAAEILDFGEDGDYTAYIVEDEEVEIPENYSLKTRFAGWLKIYDDDCLTYECRADGIEIYRAGDFGLLVKLIKKNTDFSQKSY